jgi:hypothetical protein
MQSKEYKKEYLKNWCLKNKERKKELARNWYLKNKEKVNKLSKEWYLKNKEKTKKWYKEWYLKTKKERKKYQLKYYNLNKNKIIKRQLIKEKERYHSDSNFKIIHVLRRRVRLAIKNGYKNTTTLKLLGVPNVEFLWKHLESTFKPGMTKENHGKVWHMDHILPCVSFNLNDPNEQKKCFHYTNLQALFVHENLSKGSKIIKQDLTLNN